MTSEISSADINDTKVQVELSSNMLHQLLKSGVLHGGDCKCLNARLLKSGVLHGGDCKCLNASAKKVLWQALLATSTDDGINVEQYLCA